jgi:hypothetical protein
MNNTALRQTKSYGDYQRFDCGGVPDSSGGLGSGGVLALFDLAPSRKRTSAVDSDPEITNRSN